MKSCSKHLPAIVAFLAVLTAACHQITEFSALGSSSLTVLSVDDLQQLGAIEGIPLGRSLVSPGPGEAVVISSDGTLYRLDLVLMSVDTSYSIGGSSGTGYGEAVIDILGDLYVPGPGSQVIEVDLGSNTVTDNFSPGSMPFSLDVSPAEEKIYFADRLEYGVGEIWTYSNVNGFFSQMPFQPSDISVEPSLGRHIVIGTSSDSGYVYGIWLDLGTTARRIANVKPGRPCGSVLCLGVDSVYVLTFPQWEQENGVLRTVQGFLVPDAGSYCELQGHPVELCFGGSSTNGTLFVLCRTDQGTTVVNMITFPESYLDPQLEMTLAMDGFPRDIAFSSNGEQLLVLTSD